MRKTRFVSFILIGFLFVVLTSCITVNATKLGPDVARPPVPTEEVVIYRTADQVPGQYSEVALLNARADSTMTNEAEMYEVMKKKAGQLGANAIILEGVYEPSAGAKIAGELLGTGAERKGKAVAIFIFPPEENQE